MDKETLERFYVGAAMYLDLDSDQVDAILEQAGLDPETDSLESCRVAVRAAVPRETWEAGAAGRVLFNGDAEKLLTTPEVAEILDVSERRVRALALKRGVGRVVAGVRLFRPKDVELLQPDPRWRESRNRRIA